jgi:hypothetical protein
MRWKINNRNVWQSDAKYRIKWDKKAPSKGAQIVKDYLKKWCYNYIWYEEYFLPKTRLRIDYLCPSKLVAIEFDGPQHQSYNKFFHGSRAGYLASIKRDVKKTEILESNGYTVINLTEEDLPKLNQKFFLV